LIFNYDNHYIADQQQVGNPNETAENEDDSLASVEIAQFKREVYHKIFRVILRPLERPSHIGEAVICSDQLIRILHLGILIQVVDGEEARGICGTRGAQANYPCPCCLVPKELQYQIS